MISRFPPLLFSLDGSLLSPLPTIFPSSSPNSFFREIFSPHPRFPHTYQTVFPVSKKFLQIHAKEDAGEVGKTKVSFSFGFSFVLCCFHHSSRFPGRQKKEPSRNNRAFEFRRREAAAASFHLLFSGKLHHAAAIAFSRKTRLGSLDPFDPLACSNGIFFLHFPGYEKDTKKLHCTSTKKPCEFPSNLEVTFKKIVYLA